MMSIAKSSAAQNGSESMTRFKKMLALLAASCWLIVAAAHLSAQESKPPVQNSQPVASVGQLYFYTIKDRPSFEEGYRRHLGWHAGQNDQLVWYAWTIDSGARKGAFVDGTFGATFAGLDARPDPSGDGADWGRNVASYVTALDIETWTLWALPSTATPLEDRRPGTALDVFLLQVDPAEASSFEAAMESLAKTKRDAAKLSWYRVVRGNNLPAYVLLLTRKNWADIGSAGPTLSEMLANAYARTPAQVAEVLRHVRTIRGETWGYEPRLTLIPGRPLEP
jgi:hypothetical protein